MTKKRALVNMIAVATMVGVAGGRIVWPAPWAADGGVGLAEADRPKDGPPVVTLPGEAHFDVAPPPGY